MHPKQYPYLGSRLLAIMIKVINFGGTLQVHPFYWDEKAQMLVQRKNSSTMIFHWFFTSFAFTNVMFVLIRTIITEFPTSMNKLLGIFSCIYLAFPVLFYAGLWGQKAAFCNFVNHGVQLLKEFDRHTPNFYSQRQALKTKLLDYALTGTAISVFTSAVLFCVVNLLNPKFVMFLSSLLDDPYDYYSSWPVLALSVLFMAMEEYVIVSMAYLIIFPASIVTFPMIRAIENLMSSRSHPKQILSRYKHLYLVFIELNSIYGPILLPATQFFAISLSIFGAVGPFLFPGLVGYSIAGFGVIVYVLMVIIFRYLAEFHLRAEKTLGFWKRHLVYHSRDLAAVRPVQIRLGSWGYVDPGIILTQTNIVVGNSINLLLLKRA